MRDLVQVKQMVFTYFCFEDVLVCETDAYETS